MERECDSGSGDVLRDSVAENAARKEGVLPDHPSSIYVSPDDYCWSSEYIDDEQRQSSMPS